MRNKMLYKLLFLSLTLFFNCKKDKASSTLILNPSFESNGQATYQGWNVSDTSLANFSQDTPPNGGNWSLQLFPGSTQGNTAFEGYADAHINGISGTNTFTLKAWIKNSNSQKAGFIQVGVLSGNKLTQQQTLNANNLTSWQQYTLNCTLTTQSSDIIIGRLSAGGLGNFGVNYNVLFDLIEFSKSK